MNAGALRKMNNTCQGINNVCGVQLALLADSQAVKAKLIEDVQRSKSSAIVGKVMNEVIGPDALFNVQA